MVRIYGEIIQAFQNVLFYHHMNANVELLPAIITANGTMTHTNTIRIVMRSKSLTMRELNLSETKNDMCNACIIMYNTTCSNQIVLYQIMIY